jgi:hypothetical protein
VLPGSRPRRLAAISHQPPSLLAAVSRLSRKREREMVTLRQAVYRQSVRLGDRPLEIHGQFFFPTEHLRLKSSGNILSDERMGLSFTIAASSRQRSHSQVRIPRTHDHILLSQIRDSPNLEDQVPVFISPRNRMTRLYPQVLGSLFVASYDSQGYGRLQRFLSRNTSWSSLYSLGTNRTENISFQGKQSAHTAVP